ncbi:cytochrome c oxidase subunit II [Cellvibrio japonicus]|nr:cytochrome c oxidase subunit II [Cellvibrio japonicus]QEI17649.1 cytochrome c oxidase subunit II [Cellvibrio japonicus]QEI21223.1 cytochrome c oxidase subunit II [Cellvibrio japonicus]
MTRGVTDISQQVYQLHMIIFYICCAIAVVVFGLMFWSIVRHRKSKGNEPAKFHGSLKMEVLWTAIPVVILVVMAIPATKTLIAMEDTSKADITVLVTGSQWKWHYKYLEYPIDFYSRLSTPREQIVNEAEKDNNYLLEVDKPLVIPTDKKVRFLVTSDDVIHSWWVPAFAVKKDANPGFINETWARVNKPGVYRGQCAELCGKDHAYMPVVVEAKSPQEFERWTQQQIAEIEAAKAAEAAKGTMSMDELMALGKTTYDTHCAACHQVSGEGLAGVIPALKGSVMATQDMPGHIHIVLHGKPGTAMQAYSKQLSNSEMAAVITYERNAWGNSTGDLVQPADIAAALNAEKP